ncbi:hypothetical protein C5708_10290 [Caulobacter sp. CCUG 60055]|uniref:DUF4870 family protein n=1 Tax=Caulobacter sp. CCUG 60055 TaxID=2100090 RepID=UPI001FA70993|nr:DUF4870 domain-containing protein [Caulobacter sp. CCUG 60055]MBQ1543893.1 hypothetical protein [Caulobacteraceae bacterium]MCI3180645.1 hypothetical protein [Caulobacter sp. CCUG 60055]
MADAAPEAPQPQPVAPADDKTMPIVVYALYLATCLTFGLASVVGLVLAYVNKEAAPDWIKSHYVFQIRTFWIWLIASFVGGVLTVIGVGVLILLAAGVWFAVRSIVGLVKLINGEAYPNPQSWFI